MRILRYVFLLHFVGCSGYWFVPGAADGCDQQKPQRTYLFDFWVVARQFGNFVFDVFVLNEAKLMLFCIDSHSGKVYNLSIP